MERASEAIFERRAVERRGPFGKRQLVDGAGRFAPLSRHEIAGRPVFQPVELGPGQGQLVDRDVLVLGEAVAVERRLV